MVYTSRVIHESKWVIRCTTLAKTADFITEAHMVLYFGFVMKMLFDSTPVYWLLLSCTCTRSSTSPVALSVASLEVHKKLGGQLGREREEHLEYWHWSSQENIIQGESNFPGNGWTSASWWEIVN